MSCIENKSKQNWLGIEVRKTAAAAAGLTSRLRFMHHQDAHCSCCRQTKRPPALYNTLLVFTISPAKRAIEFRSIDPPFQRKCAPNQERQVIVWWLLPQKTKFKTANHSPEKTFLHPTPSLHGHGEKQPTACLHRNKQLRRPTQNKQNTDRHRSPQRSTLQTREAVKTSTRGPPE